MCMCGSVPEIIISVHRGIVCNTCVCVSLSTAWHNQAEGAWIAGADMHWVIWASSAVVL